MFQCLSYLGLPKLLHNWVLFTFKYYVTYKTTYDKAGMLKMDIIALASLYSLDALSLLESF